MSIMTKEQLVKKVLASNESREQIAYKAGVSYSWLSKVLLNQIDQPRFKTMEKMETYFRRAK